LDAFPLTPNGKIDRCALQARPLALLTTAFAAPSSATEVAVAELFGELMRVERVGAEDDFFALGGHSLLATQLLSRLRRAVGVELGLRALVEAPTVRRLSERIEGAGLRSEVAALPALFSRQWGEKQPLSHAQQRLWLLQQLEPSSTAYNVATALRIRGELDVGALERAFEQVIGRHEAL